MTFRKVEWLAISAGPISQERFPVGVEETNEFPKSLFCGMKQSHVPRSRILIRQRDSFWNAKITTIEHDENSNKNNKKKKQ